MCHIRKVDVRLPGKGDSNSHGGRPVHLIITMIKWIRTSRLSKKNSLSLPHSLGSGSMEVWNLQAKSRDRCRANMAHIRQSKARFRPWLPGKTPQNLLSCPLFTRKRWSHWWTTNTLGAPNLSTNPAFGFRVAASERKGNNSETFLRTFTLKTRPAGC